MRYIFGPIVTIIIVLSILGHSQINALSPSEKIQACLVLEQKSKTNKYLRQLWDKKCQNDINTNNVILSALDNQDLPTDLVSKEDIQFLLKSNDMPTNHSFTIDDLKK